MASFREEWRRRRQEQERQGEQQRRILRLAEASDRLHDFLTELSVLLALDDGDLADLLDLHREWYAGDVELVIGHDEV